MIRLDDVKEQVNIDSQESAVEKPTDPASQAGEEKPEESSIPAQPEIKAEKTIPYGRFAEMNKKYRDAQRQLAELQRQSQLSQYQPEDAEAVMAHPMFQELALKVAKQELTDYAREVMDQYPSLNPVVKKAVLKNVRGFVNETTSDIEEAKLDIVDYIESIAEEAAESTPQKPAQKTFPVAQTNVSQAAPSARPADIARILQKPVDEWTEEDAQIVDDYQNRNPGK